MTHMSRGLSIVFCVCLAAALPAQTDLGGGIEQDWFHHSTSDMGVKGLFSARVNGVPEVYLSVGEFQWGVLQWRTDRDSPRLEPVYVSPYLPRAIERVLLADVLGDASPEVLVLLELGELHLFDAKTREHLDSFEAEFVNSSYGLGAADVDGDGRDEILVSRGDFLRAYEGDGTELWTVSGAGGERMAVGQLDDDPSLEVALSNGQIVDVDSRTVQWTMPDSFFLSLVDIDQDGRDELITERVGYFQAYDVEIEQRKWAFETTSGRGLLIDDVDSDGELELVQPRDHNLDIAIYDLDSLTLESEIVGTAGATGPLLKVDIDADGDSELLWSGHHHGVADLSSRTTLWTLVSHAVPALTHPAAGDIDGDGRDEVLLGTGAVRDEDGGRIYAFSREDRVPGPESALSLLFSFSDPVENIRDVQTVDADGDGDSEVLVLQRHTERNVNEIGLVLYDYDAANNSLTPLWTVRLQEPLTTINSMLPVDLEGDGRNEILLGTGQRPAHLIALDASTGLEIRRSPEFNVGSSVRNIILANVDDEPRSELLALVSEPQSTVTLYVLDLQTQFVEATISGKFTSAGTYRTENNSFLILGDEFGDGHLYRFNETTRNYEFLATRTFAQGRIDGFTLGPRGDVWVSAEGRLLRHKTAYNQPVWTSEHQGNLFGARLVFLNLESGPAIVGSGPTTARLYRFPKIEVR